MKKTPTEDRHSVTCPARITPEIEEFCSSHSGTSDLHFVDVEAEPFARSWKCYFNCAIGERIGLGHPVCGYTIWSTKNLFLSSEHHCVLRKPDGRFVDITPDVTGSQRILFAPIAEDFTMEDIERIHLQGDANRARVLVNHPLICEAVCILEDAARRIQRERSLASAEKRPVSALEIRRHDEAIDRSERLIDRYYQRQRDRELRSQRRKVHKRERLARKRARAKR